MPTLRLFAMAREAAGTAQRTVGGTTVAEVLTNASAEFGERFVQVLPSCTIWVNGDAATADTTVNANDEVAVLPPVSGGQS